MDRYEIVERRDISSKKLKRVDIFKNGRWFISTKTRKSAQDKIKKYKLKKSKKK